jgi:hypothetical protein
MDRTVPAAAQHILAFIYQHETRGDYNAISSFKQNKLPKKITTMTVDEVLAAGPTWIKQYGTLSSAAGAPQIIHKTLQALKDTMALKGIEKFDSDMQDRMAYQLLRQRGYDQFMSGSISVVQFALSIAKEWASMPVLAPTKNYKNANIQRGSSYYAGDGLNSAARDSADQFEAILNEALDKPAATNVKAANTPVAAATKVGAAIATGAAVVGGAGEAANQITDYQPIIDLAAQIGKYGPAVAGAIVVGIVLVVIARKLWN